MAAQFCTTAYSSSSTQTQGVESTAFDIVTLLRAAHDLAGPVMAAHDQLDTNGGQTSRASRFEALLDLAERKALSIADAEGTAA
jgi:hypothetical protein